MSEIVDFVILHTNDLHSVFESMPRIRSIFAAYEREQPPERLLRFDIGDHMDRMRIETEGTMGAANVDVMNATGYDAAVPGNNEGLTLPAEALEELYGRQAAFPVLVANLRRTEADSDSGEGGEGASWLRPRLVLERGGVRFGLFGLTAAFDPFYRELGWRATDPFEAAAAQVARLREEGADVIIALSHLGLSQDRRLAETVPGIDLVLGGHTHHLLERLERAGGAYIGAAGKFGSHVGVVRLAVDTAARRIVRCEGGAVDASSAEPDPALAALIERRASAARASMARVVARLPRALPADPDRESTLGNLLAMALRRHCDADIGIVNAGQLLAGLPAGPVTAAELLAVCPSPINPCSMLLRGASLREAIEEAMASASREREIRGFGFRGKVLGTLLLDGATVETLPSGPERGDRRVGSIYVGAEPLDDERWYRVGTIDMFTFRIGYPSLADGTEITFRLPEFLRDLLAESLASPALGGWIEAAERPRYVEARE
ncbi:bifunctional UDP-sugar hydrolase/5'-nucleotidase [Paenibacillus sp.]|uniref:bifunctional metallophosphatase/5'-nucleotidase n=1 Tax=Paenibacillus sp. TaxID=58172 RepID=UPI002D36BB4D|nr:bifunctional UDP-sugar hydrolase/5'-nucleotidase [Paenibacillus sp.]HZG58464.1 bifunctional UDP-sugar hydrolase/5'-nucleotidase [Paenibacillus sp.]